MKVLVYKWNGVSDAPLILTMRKLGVEVVTFERKILDYHADAGFAKEFLDLFHKEKADLVFSFDYFPIISSLCTINKVPYCAWIYDCPTYLLNSRTLLSEWNYIFCFDRRYAMELQACGAKHCYHFPLGVSVEYFAQTIEEATEEQRGHFRCDISFVGNFYNGEKNRIRKAKFCPYTEGYLNGLMEAQSQICGYNFIAEVLPDEIIAEVKDSCELQLSENYDYTDRQIVADAIGKEVSARERERVVAAIAKENEIHLYTGSDLPEALDSNRNIINRGYANYVTEMPLIFQESKINLNITSHTISSGIPLRVLDILACGGFCLTNYQPEIEEYFADGEELVMYVGKEDACEKIAYYLTHEEERKEIARRGQQRILERFAFEQRIQEMLEFVNLTGCDPFI